MDKGHLALGIDDDGSIPYRLMVKADFIALFKYYMTNDQCRSIMDRMFEELMNEGQLGRSEHHGRETRVDYLDTDKP